MTENDRRYLPLSNLAHRHRGLTPALAESYLEAARVCLDRHHTSPKTFSIENDSQSRSTTVEWTMATERERGAWNNRDDATRDGAYACAIAAIELVEILYAVRRAETLTGSDYYVAPAGPAPQDLEDHLRLEVSGVDSGENSVISQRLKEKIVQATNGRSNLPAIAVVVGFKAKLIKTQRVRGRI